MALFGNRRNYRLHIGFCKWQPLFQDCSNKWTSKVVAAMVFLILLLLLFMIFQPFQSEINILMINVKERPIHETNKEYLSVALDSSIIVEDFSGFNLSNKKLHVLMEPFRGSYLRIGGTMADRLRFNSNSKLMYKNHINGLLDGDDCAYENKFCNPLERPNFTMSGKEWTDLNKFANETGLNILFDLNCLLRKENGEWDSENAEDLISYSANASFNVIWQLGNEPNSFKHVFNYEVNATQLAKDFIKLRKILSKYKIYKNSLLVGPDVTNPKIIGKSSKEYLNEFLMNPGIVDAITWHQYYFNGREAYVYYFLSPEIFNALIDEINIVKEIAVKRGYDKTPIWLGETSSAYGGGAPGLSDRYISTFIWLDKLGIAAKNGIKVVVRQSLYKGHYALISESFIPNPDWWVSVFYKMLVGEKVLKCFTVVPSEVRLYCHCSKPNKYTSGRSITLYGMNMKNTETRIRLEEEGVEKLKEYQIQSFILQTRVSLLSRYIFLNNHLLTVNNNKIPDFEPINMTSNILTMPPYSLGFWIIKGNHFSHC